MFNKAFLALVILAVGSSLVVAQRGGDRGGRGGGDRGGFGGRGGGGRGGFGGGDFRQRMLERMDRNGNGTIDRDEMQGPGAGFIERMGRDAGVDTNRPISISRLIGGGDSRGRGDRGGDRNSSGTSSEDAYPTVPRFGEEDFPAFGLSPLTLAGKIVDLEKKYDRRILDYVNRTMERYDKNKNGILEHNEWSTVSWRNDPRDSDIDKDGQLTKAEMAERFTKREDSSRSSRDRGSSSSRDRGDRGRGDSGRDRASMFSRFGGGGGPGGMFGRGGGDRGGGDRGRGRGRGGGDEGRGRGGGDDGDRERRRSEWMASMVSRLDKNGDGTIQPDEVDERVRRFMGDRLQVDFSKPIKVDAIKKRITGGSKAEDAKESQKGFKTDGEKLAGRKTYASDAGRDLPNLLPDWWEKKDEDVNGQVTMSEYLTSRTQRAVEDFQEYDVNGDGVVTAREAEVVEKDKKQFDSEESSEKEPEEKKDGDS